jgi:hypothetical protein
MTDTHRQTRRKKREGTRIGGGKLQHTHRQAERGKKRARETETTDILETHHVMCLLRGTRYCTEYEGRNFASMDIDIQ